MRQRDHPDMKTAYRQIRSMGTTMDLVLPGKGDAPADLLVEEITSELDRIEQRLSVYRPDSDISVINRAAFRHPVPLDPEMHLIFTELVAYHRETRGFFDVTLKAVLDHYLEHGTEAGILPERIAGSAGMEHLVLEGDRIRFLKEGMQIDLGGYGKGYAMRNILKIISGRGVEKALVSFGGSLVYGLGSHPYGDCWKVSVPLPGTTEPLVFDLKNETLSTSGNSLNNQKKFGNSGHIVNPETLHTRRGKGVVSVTAGDPVRAEVFSTALFSAGNQRAMEIAGQFPDLKVGCFFM
ncbi:MAG TPA: FAD:protein FMN transferase [Bacteroides sp.]|nr:FAD:protein FMN transferase [Bacteroides sp.]